MGKVKQLGFEELKEPDACICCGSVGTGSEKLYKWGLEVVTCDQCAGVTMDAQGRINCPVHGVQEHLICLGAEFISEQKYGKGKLYPKKTRGGKSFYLMDYEIERIVEW